MSTETPRRDKDSAIKIPGYEVVEMIGAGGMGAVYKARQLSMGGRDVAIKMINPTLMDRPGYDKLVERLKLEAHAAGSLTDRTIVQVHEFIDGNCPAIVMEYVDGSNLAKILLERGQPPVKVALLILGDMCRALECAHAQGLIHRDIKPANVLITKGKDSHAKVLDFGLVRIEHTDSGLTVSGTPMGTVPYMSPEQVNARPDLTAQTDIFSLGVVAYELFSGSRPFEGKTSNQIMNAIINDEPRTLDELVSGDLPEEISHTVQMMLRKDLAERTPSIGMVRSIIDGLITRDALEGQRELLHRWAAGTHKTKVGWGSQRETPVPPVTPPQPVIPTVPDPPTPPRTNPPTLSGPPTAQGDRRRQISALLTVLLTVTAVAAILAAGWWLLPQIQTRKDPVAEPLSVVVKSEPPTSEAVTIDGTPYTWGRPTHLAAGRLHYIHVGNDPDRSFSFGVPDGSGQREYTVHLSQGLVTLGSAARPAPLRYRLTSRSTDITITSMSPTPVEPGFVNLNAGETLEIEAISPSGEKKQFRYVAEAGAVGGIMFLDFEQGVLYPVTLYPVDL